jgi:mannitol-1-phosphate 5-dehydrogenase
MPGPDDGGGLGVRAVIIGSGKIACGYLAPLLKAAGWQVTLAARTATTADRIRRAGRFTVTMVSATGSRTGEVRARRRTVRGCRAVTVGGEDFGRAVAEADLVCTAVGVGNVPALARPLADALLERHSGSPLDVWVVENGDLASDLATRIHRIAAERGVVLPPVGFAGAVATVAVGRGSWSDPYPEFVGDDDRRLLVDRRPCRSALPGIPGTEATDHYVAELTAKLHVFNAGHAICAYLGWLRGHATIGEAVADPFLRPIIAGSMLESRRALLATHPVLGEDVHAAVARALRRFANPWLADPVARVARDPVRKLRSTDRLVGPAIAIRDRTGRVPAYFALGIAGALLYLNDGDEQAVLLHDLLREHGVMAVLEEVCGVSPADPLAAAIAERYRGFIFAPDQVLFPPAYAEPRPLGPARELSA